MTETRRSARLIITGRVQGVGFRAFVASEARRRDLKGWVRNRRDGSVEAVIAGSSNDVDAAIEACRRGPPSGRVNQMTIEDVSGDDLADTASAAGFHVRPTV